MSASRCAIVGVHCLNKTAPGRAQHPSHGWAEGLLVAKAAGLDVVVIILFFMLYAHLSMMKSLRHAGQHRTNMVADIRDEYVMDL